MTLVGSFDRIDPFLVPTLFQPATQAFFATCLEREPTQTPKILLSVSRHVPMEETREVSLRLCRAYVECGEGRGLATVASVLRHQRMKSLTMDFMASPSVIKRLNLVELKIK